MMENLQQNLDDKRKTMQEQVARLQKQQRKNVGFPRGK